MRSLSPQLVDMKRLVDVSIAAAGLLATAPVLAICAVAIWIEDRGDPFFRQTRAGRDGLPFTITKLRTMSLDTPDVESSALADNKITRVGAILRRTNLDELPQLLSVITGQMSIVGPRPALLSQTELLGLRKANGSSALKPGLTGLAQVSSYDDMPVHEKARFDGQYFDEFGSKTDLKILVRTVAYLMRKPPKY